MRTYSFLFDSLYGNADVHPYTVIVRWNGDTRDITTCSLALQSAVWSAINSERIRLDVQQSYDDTADSRKYCF